MLVEQYTVSSVKYIYLIGCFGVQYRCIFLRVLQYFDEPAGRVKIQRTRTIQLAYMKYLRAEAI